MSDLLFRGATSVRQAVIEHLENTVPGVVDEARAEWLLDEFQLPYPVAYDAYEPYALDKWPLVGVNVVQADSFSRVDWSIGAGPRFLAKYLVRVFTWVRTPMDENEVPIEPEYSESIRLRDDLAAVMRSSILRRGHLGRPGQIILDEGSISEEYSEATGVKGNRFVAGVIHSFEIRFDESVPSPIISDPDTILNIELVYQPPVIPEPGEEPEDPSVLSGIDIGLLDRP